MEQSVPTHARLVVIGAGIVGCSLAYELTARGWRDVVVLDQGPLFENWGSSSHAPGMMFQRNASKIVCQLARWSAELYGTLRPADGPAFFPVCSLEIATRPEHWEELKRWVGQSKSWGLEAALIGPAEAKRLLPILRTDGLYGAFYVSSDCVVKTSRICAELTRVAESHGASFIANTPVIGIEVSGGYVHGVSTPQGSITTDVVVAAAGIWGPLS